MKKQKSCSVRFPALQLSVARWRSPWLRWAGQLTTLIFVLGPVSVGYAQVERCVDLGDGYDAAMIAKHSNASFESTGHWQYLRYKEKEQCLLGHYDISPDKRFVAFQESDTGKLFLLDKKEHRRFELLATFPGLVRQFDWNAKVGFLRVEIYDKEPLMIRLP